jgi:hypothetical protein
LRVAWTKETETMSATEGQDRRLPLLIPPIVKRLLDSVPASAGTREDALAAIERWCGGGDARSPLERGVFAMCAQVRDEIEELSARDAAAAQEEHEKESEGEDEIDAIFGMPDPEDAGRQG